MTNSKTGKVMLNCELSIVNTDRLYSKERKLTPAERTAKLLAVRPVNHFNSPIPKSKAAARALKTENDRLRAALLALYVVASKYAVVPDAEYCAITNAATLTESA